MSEFVNISDVIDKDQKNVSSIDWADEGYDDDGGQNKWNTQTFQAQIDSVSIKDIQTEQEKDVKPWFPEAEEKPKKYVAPQRPENRRVTIPKDTPIPNHPPYTAFVKNLEYKVGDAELREHFSEYNPSKVTVSISKENGRSRGFGYVDFQTGEDLGHALSLNGSELNGRVIEVFVKPPYQGKDNSYSSGGYKSNYNFRNRNEDQNNAPRERKSLNLAPRSKPLEGRHLNPSESDGVTPVHNDNRNNFEPEYKKPYNNNNNRQPRSEYREPRSEHRESRQSNQNDEQPRERRSLNLAPRTKPLEGRHLNPGDSDGVTPLLSKQNEQNLPPKKQESTWGRREETSSNRGRGSSQRGRGGRGGSTSTSQPRTEQKREVSSDGFQTRGGKKKNQGQNRQGSNQYSLANDDTKTSFESSNPYDLLDQDNN